MTFQSYHALKRDKIKFVCEPFYSNKHKKPAADEKEPARRYKCLYKLFNQLLLIIAENISSSSSGFSFSPAPFIFSAPA